MSIPLAVFLFGAALLAVGVLGGGIEIRELKVPRVSVVSRVLAAIVGAGFVVYGISLGNAAPQAFPVAQPPATVAPPPPTVAPTATRAAVATATARAAPTQAPATPAVAISALRVDVDTAFEEVRQGRAVLVDVRSRQEYLSSRARGAIWLWLDDLERAPSAAVAALPRDKRAILYCT